MAQNITFPTVTVNQRSELSRLRQNLTEIADWYTGKQRVGMTAPTAAEKKAILDQINALVVKIGGTIIQSGAQTVVPAPSGTRTSGYVFTVSSAGVITAAVGY